ncbi:hypothetical protein [Agromyces sp. SYSU T00194]|uniref:hypothetical protein n=1 Tax=Agromyces chitinivorans TaxID=3158560 RepID=UPI0033999692
MGIERQAGWARVPRFGRARVHEDAPRPHPSIQVWPLQGIVRRTAVPEAPGGRDGADVAVHVTIPRTAAEHPGIG